MAERGEVPEEQQFILSSLSPGQAQKRLALAIVVCLLLVYALITAGVLSGGQTRRIDAFLPAYVTAMFVCDSITAVLLFSQFSILRSRAVLVIANGYLFTALILIPYVLEFPGVFGPTGLIGGLQSAAMLYVVWHCGFSLFVIAYALSKNGDPRKALWKGTTRAAIARSLAITVTLVLLVTLVCTVGQAYLPPIMLDQTRFSLQWPYLVGAPIALLSISALVALWIRQRSMLDLWLMVVMFLYLIEVPLSYYPNPSRFSGGWYAVRGFGFLSSSVVLVVLLYEIQTLYRRLLNALIAQRREREARLMTGDAVAASIAHELRQPLTAMVTTADAGLRFLDRAVPGLDKAKEAFKRISSDGHRAAAMVGSIRANFKSDLRDRISLDLNELIQEALALAHGDLQRHRVLVRAEPNRQLPEVRGSRVELQQVFLNLITNAIDAMAAIDEPRMLSVKSEAYEGDRVLVSFADTGPGIRAQDADRVFNPLFTTKADGMGMGLSICRAIIQAHEGRLWFTPNTPRGSVFHFTLYANASTSAADSSPLAATVAPTNTMVQSTLHRGSGEIDPMSTSA
jgi:signal transduction histidine kinase